MDPVSGRQIDHPGLVCDPSGLRVAGHGLQGRSILRGWFLGGLLLQNINVWSWARGKPVPRPDLEN